MPADLPQFGQAVAGQVYKDRPGAYGVIMKRQTQQIATVRWRQHYFLPGGGIETGETAEDALRREVLEETGWSIDTISKLAQSKQYIHNEVKGVYLNKLQSFFTARPIALTTQDCEADHDLVWLSAAKAIDRLVEASHKWAVQLGRQNMSR